jgi:hypothetical protein
VIDAAGRADTGAFLVRLVRLDPGAVVRLRPAGDAAELWARLPFDVLATRRLRLRVDADVTVSAAGLLAALEAAPPRCADPDGAPDPRTGPEEELLGLPRRDIDWRWALPPGRGDAVERIPAVELVRVAAAASRALRQAATEGIGGRAVGERVLRDALLDHVAITVTGDGGARIDIPQRVVQGVVRMGFLGPVASGSKATHSDDFVTVRLAMGWTGIDASYGSVWYRPSYPMRFR